MPPTQHPEVSEPDAPTGESDRLLTLTADVGRALTTRGTLEAMLCGCAEALVRHLGGTVACLWTFNAAENMLELRAGDGPSARVPVGHSLVGRIAQERRAQLSNAVQGGGNIVDQAWARREGVTALAGCPLVVDDDLIGVAAVFARQTLPHTTLQALEAVADEIAVGIDRKQTEEALRASEERYRAAIAHAAVGVTLADMGDRCQETNAAFCAITGYSEAELLRMHFPALTHPDDREESRAMMARLWAGAAPSVVMEKRYTRKDGGVVWVQNSVALIRDSHGRPAGTVALTEDITGRKEVIARQQSFLQDVLSSVTDGRLCLCCAVGELPAPLPSVAASVALTPTEGLRELRHAVQDAARAAGHPEDRVGDLAIAASEAGMNAIVHAETGTGDVRVGKDGTIQVWVIDHGSGIALENLPNATLKKGYTTAGTMGQGMKMMLQTVDHIYLLTGAAGTTVVLEQQRESPMVFD